MCFIVLFFCFLSQYYFGNVNMQKDKFLIEQIKLDAGWIPMTIMLKFRMLASFSRNVDVILKALENSDLIEISKDRKKIRRSPNYPLPEYNEECRKAQEARTIYVTGFPLGLNIDKLKAFFESYQPIERIMVSMSIYNRLLQDLIIRNHVDVDIRINIRNYYYMYRFSNNYFVL